MKRKLFIIFFALVLLPTLALGYSNYLRTADLAYNNINQAMMQTLIQIRYNVENTIEYISLTSDNLYFDEEVKKYVGSEDGDDLLLHLKKLSNIRNKIYNFEGDRRLYKVRLYVDEQKMVSTEHVNFFAVQSIETTDWYKEIVEQYGATIWSGVYPETAIAGEPDTWLISLRRVLKHSNNIRDNDGILSVDMKETYLYSLLDNKNIRRSESIFIIDKQGNLISGGDKSKLGQPAIEGSLLDTLTDKEQGILEIGDAGKEEYVVFTTIDATEWMIIDRIDRNNMLEGYSFWGDMRFILFTIIVIMLFVAASFVIISNITNEIIKRMHRIADSIEKVGVKPEGQEIDYKSMNKDDLSKVEKMVFDMIQRSSQLAEETYEARLEERKAQLMALQAQINPHFLYNTLENINWMAIRKNAPEISTLVTVLAKYFRLSLNKGKTIVSIEDEIELIKTYLTIQNARFDNALSYQINIDPDICSYNIPKLTLQPIVENAVMHGVMKKPEKVGVITIDARVFEEEIQIIIKDDGVGMEQEKIEHLLNSQQSEHYGLYNVQERIKLYFGEKYGITIESQPEVGTKVTFHIGKI